MRDQLDFVLSMAELHAKFGYEFRDTINIFGFRDDSNQDKDEWNDYIGINLPQEEKVFLFSGTTDPGRYYTQNPYEGTTGAMHLCLGQYPNTYQIGNHHGRPALCQWNAPVKIWRDVDKDYKFNEKVDKVYKNSWNGTNIHYPGGNAEFKIMYSSAGCQVIKPDKEDYFRQWDYFFKLATDAMKHYDVQYVDYTAFDMKVMPNVMAANIDEMLDLG